MALLPTASVGIDDQSGALGSGALYLVVMSCVERNADTTPRVFLSSKGIQSLHGYAQGADFIATFIDKTKKPVIFIGLPTATAGAIGRQNSTGVTGTSAITIAAGAAGVLEEVDAIVSTLVGGTIGTPGVVINVSMDGGLTFQSVRLGTATSYTVPSLGIIINFAAGTLLSGDVYTFSTTAPKWDQAGINAAKTALSGQQKQTRSWLVVGDLQTSTEAGFVVNAVNSYETANQRFVYARVQVRDRLPLAAKSKVNGENLTFAATSLTRSGGSWISDGFRVGDTVAISGTVSNNTPKVITALTATVLSFASGGVIETIASLLATITKGEVMSAWVSAMDLAFATIDGQRRIDLGLGRLRAPASLITGWRFRRPVQWAATIREYVHDLHIPCWRKADGILDGWDLDAGDGNIVEYDENSVGGALAARFTCARSYSNGPVGSFIALSLTRAPETSLLSRTHNMAVANAAMSTVQASSENLIGSVLELDSTGRATAASLTLLEEGVNRDLEISLLQNKLGEGKRASKSVWKADPSAILNVPGATLPGVLTLNLNGTIEQIVTSVKVS